MIRRLLAVVPAVVLVGCGPATVQGAGHADAPARSSPVATRVAAAPTTTELAVPSVAASAVRTVARTAVSRRTVQPAPTDGCNRNYTPCVPDDPVDVDCAGGSGNGPSYVTGPVRVVGDDVYGLDADGNGVGCEAGAAHSQAAAPQAPPPPEEPPSTTRAAPPTTTAPPRTSKAPFRTQSAVEQASPEALRVSP